MYSQYKSVRTGKILNLTQEQANLFLKIGMEVTLIGPSTIFQNAIPKSVGGIVPPMPIVSTPPTVEVSDPVVTPIIEVPTPEPTSTTSGTLPPQGAHTTGSPTE